MNIARLFGIDKGGGMVFSKKRRRDVWFPKKQRVAAFGRVGKKPRLQGLPWNRGWVGNIAGASLGLCLIPPEILIKFLLHVLGHFPLDGEQGGIDKAGDEVNGEGSVLLQLRLTEDGV